MYHNVAASQGHLFVRQMEKLKKFATPIATDSISKLKKDRNYVAVTFDDGFALTIDVVFPVLNKMSIPATFFIPTAYLGKEAMWITDNRRRQCVGCVITAEKLKQFSEHSFVTIGSHGIKHVRLAEVRDSEASEELAESKKQLENITHKAIKTHSFPFGSYEVRHVTMARNAGYDRVFTVDPTISFGTDEEFVTGRIEVDPTDWPIEFMLKLAGAYRWQPYVSHLKKIFFANKKTTI